MMSRLLSFLAVGLALLLAFALVGCSGGNSGGSGKQAQVQAVTVTDNGQVATMEVAFRLSDDGEPLSGVADNSIRFSVAKLIPAASPSAWQSYVNAVEDVENPPAGWPPAQGAPNVTGEATHAATEFASTEGGVFTDNGDGTYSYKFSFNFRAVTDPVTGDPIAYDPSFTHRIAMQVSDNATNATYDFIPNNMSATPGTRSIVANIRCSECHEKFGFHGGDRVAVEYCVTCHNPGTTDANSGNTVDFKVMVHKIHSGENGPEVEAGGEYAIWGYRNTKHDYSDLLYPQDTINCAKCHDGSDPETPDGDNWKNVPSAAACTSCHDAPDPADYPTFPDLTAAEIETVHLTPNATPNNPNLPAGVPSIEYVLNSATVDGANQAVINFQILRDDVPIDLINLPADLTAAGNRPTFLLGYAQDQGDGIAEPAEYNNLGRTSGQPQSVSLSSVTSLVDDGDGTFTATIASAFPAGATLRAVGLQGYFQVDTDGDNAADYPLHTPSAVVAVSGDDARREVVDNNSCASCHEWFEGHGGNRVFNMNICVFCHNPNLSSSGRGIETPNAANVAAYGADPLVYPEATNNFKDMVHGIHGAAQRTTDYEFVRGGFRQNPYNWSDVVFPGRAADCLICHKSGTFTVPLDDDTLLTTNRTTGVADGNDPDRAAVLAAQDGASLPNPTDWVITPAAAACYACHDSTEDQAHMEQNGALINENRNDPLLGTSVETCSVCHGTGKTADLAVVHAATEAATVIGRIAAPDSSGGSVDDSQAALCGPGPLSARPPGHSTSLDCCSCHGFN
ncbi:Decaheme cytochrome c MtrF [Olavius sp. associated proteobacterium Delta 1]|nr:Decaheme cytochrome c MtrF [Olavius sp. associated proteobacterium Delta 1]